jgi:hypothetical protein
MKCSTTKQRLHDSTARSETCAAPLYFPENDSRPSVSVSVRVYSAGLA